MRALSLSIGLLMSFAVANAHHSRAGFLIGETFEIEGTVTELAWRTPHLYLELEATDDTGSAVVWTFEGHSIAGLIRNGWEKDSVEEGDRVVIVANPNRNPETKFGLLDNVTLTDGSTFYSFRVPRGAAGGRVPTQTPVVTASTDFSGVWRSGGGGGGGAASAGGGGAMGAAGASPAGNNNAAQQRGLVGGFSPPTGLPLTDVAQAQVDAFDLNDDPWLDCEPLSVPRVIFSPFSHGWTRTPDSIVIRKELSPMIRTIHLDGSPRPDDYEPNPTDYSGFSGYSRGHFESDGTLVIETTGFAATRWGIERGIDSSTQKRVVERFKLTEDGTGMTVSYTLEDPVYLSEPVTRSGRYTKIADHELAFELCDLETTRRHLQFE